MPCSRFLFCFHEKKVEQAQEQAKGKGKVFILAFVLALLLVLKLTGQGRFHGEIGTLALALEYALVLAALEKTRLKLTKTEGNGQNEIVSHMERSEVKL